MHTRQWAAGFCRIVNTKLGIYMRTSFPSHIQILLVNYAQVDGIGLRVATLRLGAAVSLRRRSGRYLGKVGSLLIPAFSPSALGTFQWPCYLSRPRWCLPFPITSYFALPPYLTLPTYLTWLSTVPPAPPRHHVMSSTSTGARPSIIILLF
jgi:hypothetical protein